VKSTMEIKKDINHLTLFPPRGEERVGQRSVARVSHPG
jgi:hypothetical protein